MILDQIRSSKGSFPIMNAGHVKNCEVGPDRTPNKPRTDQLKSILLSQKVNTDYELFILKSFHQISDMV